MLEPLVQDYVPAAMQLARDSFRERVRVPVLVTIAPQLEESFQTARTRALDDMSQLGPHNRADLLHQAKVLELRPIRRRRLLQVTIGRSEENDIVLQDETVSSHHAIFTQHPSSGKPLIQDQESTNGTRINNQLLIPYKAVRVHDGDLLSFGDVTFLFFTPAGFYDALQSLVQETA
ncbi:MAG: FHA domain-containing protein [Deltaproteobacteria bacterium]|nr:FHA domain-containing protein [Deltaproteobacteria bacterium]